MCSLVVASLLPASLGLDCGDGKIRWVATVLYTLLLLYDSTDCQEV